MNVLSLLSGYSRNLHMKVIFNFHTPFFSHTHTTLSNASTSSQSHAPPGSHASTSSHTSRHWLHAWLSADHSQQAVSSAPPRTPRSTDQLTGTPPPPTPTTRRQPRAQLQKSHHTASATSQSLTCSRVGAALGHRNCCSTQPPSLPPAPALQPQPRARASHAAE